MSRLNLCCPPGANASRLAFRYRAPLANPWFSNRNSCRISPGCSATRGRERSGCFARRLGAVRADGRASLAVLALVVGFLVAAGALRAAQSGRYHLSRRRRTAFGELLRTSPRRVWALARLAIKESLRRRVIVALADLALILLFAGWFLQTGYPRAGQAVLQLRAHRHDLSGAADRAVRQCVQPAERFQDRRRSTRSSPSRCGPATSCSAASWASRSSARCCWRSWGCAATGSCGGCSTTRIRSTSRRARKHRRRRGQVVGKNGRTTTDQLSPPRSRNESGRRRPRDLDERARARRSPAKSRQAAKPCTSSAARKDLLRARVPQYGKLRFLDRNGRRRDEGHQRRQRVDVSQLHRRRHAGGRDLDVRAASTNQLRKTRTARDPAARTDRPRVPHVTRATSNTAFRASIQLRNPR